MKIQGYLNVAPGISSKDEMRVEHDAKTGDVKLFMSPDDSTGEVIGNVSFCEQKKRYIAKGRSKTTQMSTLHGAIMDVVDDHPVFVGATERGIDADICSCLDANPTLWAGVRVGRASAIDACAEIIAGKRSVGIETARSAVVGHILPNTDLRSAKNP